MAARADQKEESQARILASAGQGFRSRGYGGLGVDELARQAGVTSGGFYAHFRSKAAAFRAAVGQGLDELRAGIAQFRAAEGADWRDRFVDFYLGARRRAELGESCALQSLAGDVARADPDARLLFEDKLRQVLDVLTDAAPDAPSRAIGRQDSIALLALLSGAVSMARAVNDPSLQEEIADAARQAARGLTRRMEAR